MSRTLSAAAIASVLAMVTLVLWTAAAQHESVDAETTRTAHEVPRRPALLGLIDL